ncbi:hypothetical protein Plec18170_005316 [Paecilomyces lecythidis]
MLELIVGKLQSLRTLADESDLWQWAPRFAAEFYATSEQILSATLQTAANEALNQGHSGATACDGEATPVTTMSKSSGIASPQVVSSYAPEMVTAYQQIYRMSSPSWTFSFQETSLPRRLARSYLERSYHLLSNFQENQTEASRLLQLLLEDCSIDYIRSWTKDLLLRSTTEPLQYEERPRIPTVENVRHTVRLMASSRYLRGFPVAKIHVSGCEGDWLSPDAVVSYLEELGISIENNHNSTYVQWVIPKNRLGDILSGVPGARLAALITSRHGTLNRPQVTCLVGLPHKIYRRRSTVQLLSAL